MRKYFIRYKDVKKGRTHSMITADTLQEIDFRNFVVFITFKNKVTGHNRLIIASTEGFRFTPIYTEVDTTAHQIGLYYI